MDIYRDNERRISCFACQNGFLKVVVLNERNENGLCLDFNHTRSHAATFTPPRQICAGGRSCPQGRILESFAIFILPKLYTTCLVLST